MLGTRKRFAFLVALTAAVVGCAPTASRRSGEPRSRATRSKEAAHPAAGGSASGPTESTEAQWDEQRPAKSRTATPPRKLDLVIDANLAALRKTTHYKSLTTLKAMAKLMKSPLYRTMAKQCGLDPLSSVDLVRLGVTKIPASSKQGMLLLGKGPKLDGAQLISCLLAKPPKDGREYGPVTVSGKPALAISKTRSGSTEYIVAVSGGTIAMTNSLAVETATKGFSAPVENDVKTALDGLPTPTDKGNVVIRGALSGKYFSSVSSSGGFAGVFAHIQSIAFRIGRDGKKWRAIVHMDMDRDDRARKVASLGSLMRGVVSQKLRQSKSPAAPAMARILKTLTMRNEGGRVVVEASADDGDIAQLLQLSPGHPLAGGSKTTSP